MSTIKGSVVLFIVSFVSLAGCAVDSRASEDEATEDETSALAVNYCEIDATHTVFTGRCNKTTIPGPSSCYLPTSAACPAGQPATFKSTSACGTSLPLTSIQLATTRCF